MNAPPKCPLKINGGISELQKKLREEEAIKARKLLVLAGKMTQFEALEIVRKQILNGHNNGTKK